VHAEQRLFPPVKIFTGGKVSILRARRISVQFSRFEHMPILKRDKTFKVMLSAQSFWYKDIVAVEWTTYCTGLPWIWISMDISMCGYQT